MPEPAPIIDIGREREQRKILPIHVVLQIKHPRETGAGNLRLVPRAIWALRRKQITETTLHARPIEFSARANPHDRPGSLRGRALTLAFEDRVLVRRASLTPAAVVILTALDPIAPTQNPILRHVLADGAQTAEHLPRSVNVIHAPAAIPGAVVVLGIDEVLHRLAHGRFLAIEIDVAKKFQRARRP